MVAERASEHAAEPPQTQPQAAGVREKMQAEDLTCQAAGAVRVTETTSEVEARKGILVEPRHTIKVSQDSSTGATQFSAYSEALDGEADSAFEDESADLAANIDALTNAVAALEKGGAVSSFLKSAVMKFGPDAGENPFVERVRG